MTQVVNTANWFIYNEAGEGLVLQSQVFLSLGKGNDSQGSAGKKNEKLVYDAT